MLVETQPAPADSARLRQIVEQHYSSIYGYAYRLSGSVADAEDLTQQTFMIAHQRLHQVREQDKIIRWLYTIARTSFLKSRRRTRPSAAANFELNVDEIPERFPEDSPIDEERLQNAVGELGDDFKVVVTMFYFEELSYKEIAAELDIPIGTVMSRLARAKGHLRHVLADAPSETVHVRPR
ncbi:MAG: RNA polymerase sigma factor [Planctomycetota bacterium]